MKSIQSPYTEYRRYFPAFPETGSYRKQPFCVRADVKSETDSAVLYNTLSGEILTLSAEEDALWTSAPNDGITEDKPFWKLLAAHDFIVPEDTDMMSVLEKGRSQAQAVVGRLDSFISGTYSYVILTTTDCNARCFYCYEKGRSRIPMNSGTALRTAKFIEKNFRRNGRKVSIQWFGGEPLYNTEAIRIICGYLTDKGVPFSSSMISNGYLLTEDIQKEAAKEWHLERVQITLDGTEDTYNRCKSFIYPSSEGSAFRRVMDNILSTARNGIKVSIRMNVDSHNFENLMELTGLLAEKTAEDELLRGNISVYSHPLFDGEAHPKSENRSEKVAAYDIALTQRTQELGISGHDFKRGDVVKNGLEIHFCMVDSPFSLTILPDGHLGKCEHFTEDHFVGDLEEGINPEAIRQINGFKAYRDECRTCPFPPICLKAGICPDYEQNACITESLTRKAKTDMALKLLYDNFSEKAKPVPAEISYTPKLGCRNLPDSPLEVIASSHNEYAVAGGNGNALSISFISVLEMGSHSIQAIQFNQIGDRRKFTVSDENLLKSIAEVSEWYLREHGGDLLMMCSPDNTRNRAVHRFAGMCFDRFGYGDDFRRISLDGPGSDGEDYLLTVFLSKECPSYEDVVSAVSRQSKKMIDYYKEISDNGKRTGLQDYGRGR